MDYKKEYEEKISKARTLHKLAVETNNDNTRMALEELYPELKESEDERIRKELIKVFEERVQHCFEWKDGIPNNAVIAWLEKQVEQKPVDKVEPKFKVGDWVVANNGEPNIHRVEKIWWPDCIISGSLGNEFINTFTLDKQYHLWTIQDAKDGDVLAVDYIIFIYKRTLASHIVSYCRLIGKEFDRFEYARTCNEGNAYVHPATKEQRDLLFQKMKEAGYEWDDETKELKKINLIKAEHGKYYYCIKDYFSGGKKFASKGDVVIALRGLPIMGLEDISEYFLPVTNVQNPTWGEEDERNLSIAIQYVYEHGYFSVVNWLKSLKDRVQPKPKQELSWSEEDEEMFDAIIADIQFTQKAHTHEVNHVVYEREIDWLKSLKDRVQPKSKQEWSEKDEETLNNILNDLRQDVIPDDEDIQWLKSLKERYTWKPSDEQIRVLEYYMNVLNCNEHKKALFGLYEQLKSL